MKIRYTFYIIFLFYLLSFSAIAQSPKRLINLIEKNKWGKALEIALKLEKSDSISPVSYYTRAYLSIYDSTYQLPIDSSYVLINRSLYDLDNSLNDKLKKQYTKAKIDSALVIGLREIIESIAFDSTLMIDTEEAYIKFLAKYAFAKERENAIERRNQLAYQYALRINTPEAFQQFYNKYPDAEQVKNAKEFYESRLFEERTKDKKIESYRSFLVDYPSTPFKKEIEKQLFQLMTASGSKSDILSFIEAYPYTDFNRQAAWMLFSLNQDKSQLFASLNKWSFDKEIIDSLTLVNDLYKENWFPIFENQAFRFINSKGENHPYIRLNTLDSAYACRVLETFYILDDSKKGKKIYNHFGDEVAQNFDQIEQLEYHMLHLKNDNRNFLYHPAFGLIESEADQLRTLGGFLFGFKVGELWHIQSHSGEKLVERLEDVFFSDGFIFCKKNGKWSFHKAREIAKIANQFNIDFNFQFDKIAPYLEGFNLVYANKNVGLIKKNEGLIIPAIYDEITSEGLYWWLERADTFEIVGKNNDIKISHISDYKVRFNQFAIEKEGKWALWAPQKEEIPIFEWDSISITSPSLFLGKMNDTLYIFNSRGKRVKLGDEISFRLHFNANESSHAYLELSFDKGRKTIYNHMLDPIFKAEQATFSWLNEKHLSITQKNKKGIINDQGRIVLPIDKDVIANPSDDLVSTLLKQQIGAFDFKNSISLPNEYQSQIKRYAKSDSLYIAEVDGKKGLIDKENMVLVNLEYDDIIAVSDSICFGLKDENYKLIYIYDSEQQSFISAQKLRKLEFESENFFLLYGEKGYGLLNSKGQLIIPMSFTEITPFISSSRLVFRTEKEFRELDYHIMAYHDSNGQVFYKTALDAEIYDLFICD